MLNKAMPPVAVAYQSTACPAIAVTINAGTGCPAQITGLLGAVGGGTVAQLQLGEVTDCCAVQVPVVAVMVIFVPVGIPEIRKLPADGFVTVPAVAVTLAALLVTATE